MAKAKAVPGLKAGKGKAAAAEPAAAVEAVPVEEVQGADKKKRNNNPGVRVQGGRVYDSENGTTCHQCRQKTIEVKAKCNKCTLYFCPKCLENRYHEKVEQANATKDWQCPRCRGACNCSNCRKKAGLEATGILSNVAKTAGFGSVHDLLQKNPNAKAISMPKPPQPAPATKRAFGKEERQQQQGAAKKQRQRAEGELVDDSQLPPRRLPLPAPEPLAVHIATAGAGGAAGSRRQRGAAWAADLPATTPLPEGVCQGELAAVLEFLQVFAPKLGLRLPSLPALAAELLQSPQRMQRALLCPAPEESLVAQAHCRLLQLVRGAWDVAGTVSTGAWQGIMRAYFAACLLPPKETCRLQEEHGPPAIAGELFTRPQDQREGSEEADDGSSSRSRRGAAAAAEAEYPAGGYWGLQPATRVSMLHALVHDALDCYELRSHIEGSMGDALAEDKERRQELAEVRKQSREQITCERNKQIALVIASTDTKAMTVDQQRQLLDDARQRAEAAASNAAAAKVMALSDKVHPPTFRAGLLGTDREGRRYLQLQCAPLLAGGPAVVVQSVGPEASADGASSAGEAFGCHPGSAVAAVAAALDEQGRGEGPLRAALLHAFKVPAAAMEALAATAPPQRQQSPEAGPAPARQAANGRKGQRVSPAAADQPAAEAAQAPVAKPGAGKGRAACSPAAGKTADTPSKESSPAGSGGGSSSSKGAKRGRTAAAVAAPEAAPPPTKRGRPAAAATSTEPSAQPAKRGRASAAAPKRAAPSAKAAPVAGGKTRSSLRLPLKIDDLVATA